MAITDSNIEERGINVTHHSDKSENGVTSHKEEVQEETTHEAAERGRAATDQLAYPPPSMKSILTKF